MIQLILDTGGFGLKMPETEDGAFDIKEESAFEDVIMISNRIAREKRPGKVWRITYQYGYLTPEEMGRFIAACEKGIGEPIICSFLPHGATSLQTANFLVMSYRRPKFMWSQDGKPLYGDYFVDLREVRPHA